MDLHYYCPSSLDKVPHGQRMVKMSPVHSAGARSVKTAIQNQSAEWVEFAENNNSKCATWQTDPSAHTRKFGLEKSPNRVSE